MDCFYNRFQNYLAPRKNKLKLYQERVLTSSQFISNIYK